MLAQPPHSPELESININMLGQNWTGRSIGSILTLKTLLEPVINYLNKVIQQGWEALGEEHLNRLAPWTTTTGRRAGILGIRHL